jgi:flagellar biosynthetic protein FlhB
MADSAAEKTEQPTSERLRKARGQGQIAQSQELPSALLLGGLLAASALAASGLWRWFTGQVEDGLSLQMSGEFEIPALVYLFKTKTTEAFIVILPFLGAATLGGILGSVLVGGWAISPAAIKLNFGRLAPSSVLKTLFSPRSAVTLLVAMAKLGILTGITWWYLRDKLDVCLALASATPLAGLTTMLGLVFGLVARITIALAAIAIADVIYQKWQYKRDLRMTREEVKEEHKQHVGSPIVRARVRSFHLALARKRMLRDVPNADVIITNPTHVAVALKYDAAAMAAPQVIAKGADILCEKIKEIARKHGVPVIERPELARTLYAAAEVGQTIPEALYVAVAEILALIYRLRRQG